MTSILSRKNPDCVSGGPYRTLYQTSLAGVHNFLVAKALKVASLVSVLAGSLPKGAQHPVGRRGPHRHDLDDLADRMKAKSEHRVPLSVRHRKVLDEAMCIKGQITPAAAGGLLFPSVRANATMSKFLRELWVDAVPHGFRSSVRG